MEYIVVIIIIYVIYRIVKANFSKGKSLVRPEAAFQYKIAESDNFTTSKKQSRGKPAKWYEAGQGVRVQGYEITGGLVYVGKTLPDFSGYSDDACLINPALDVLPAEPWEAGDEIGYWPQYSNISSRCRGAYLKWLAGGRSEPEANIAYVFLFFYGLERRLFVDGQTEALSAEERAEIVQEVRRLLSIYCENRSFRGYASNLLAMEWVLYQNNRPIPDYLDFDDRYCLEPFQFILAKYVAVGKPISAGVAHQWSILHPEIYLRTPAQRCPKEFKELFCRRYQEQLGDGLIVKPNKTRLTLEYHAASSSLRGHLQFKMSDLPSPFLLTEPMKTLSSLVEACTADLDSYSRFIGRKGSDPNSLAALALLPKELMKQSPVTQKAQFQLAQVCSSSVGLMSVESLYECFDEQPPLKINKKESENLAALVEGIGFGIAPDSRYHHIKPSLDGKVAVFLNGHGADFRPSKEYWTLATILRLGAMVSQIDDDISPAEEALLQSLVNENQDLSQIEKDSLLAFLQWCLHTPQGTSGIRQRLAEISEAGRIAMSHILISVAYADGVVDPREVKQLEKLYSALGLNKEQVISDLHALAAANEPVTVSLRDFEPTFSLPKPRVEATKPKIFSLNEELIRIRTEETRQVRGVLEGVFSDQEEEEEELVENDITPTLLSAENPLAALDKAHQDFFHRLLEQERWERRALYELCKEFGLMLDGAMEVLNEWAFDNANAPLIDDGDPVFVDVNLAREIIDGQ